MCVYTYIYIYIYVYIYRTGLKRPPQPGLGALRLSLSSPRIAAAPQIMLSGRPTDDTHQLFLMLLQFVHVVPRLRRCRGAAAAAASPAAAGGAAAAAEDDEEDEEAGGGSICCALPPVCPGCVAGI
jgi:hypothetical protein